MTIPIFTGTVPALTQTQPQFDVNTQNFIDYIADLAPELNAFASNLNKPVTSSSNTSLLVGTGSKTLTVGTGLGFQVGLSIRLAYSDTVYMTGEVTSYNASTGELITNITSSVGVGTYTSWSVYAIQSTLGQANKFTGLQTFADEVAVASASTINITTADGNNIEITGTTTITAVTMPEGAVIKARASGAFQLTNSSTLIVQGGANYTTTVNDILTFTKDGAGNVHVEINKINGQAVVSPTVITATSDPTFADSSNNPPSTNWIKGLFGITYSSERTLTADTNTTIAHGLSYTPFTSAYLICKVADAGWAVGDRVNIASVSDNAPEHGFITWSNATNYGFIIGDNAIAIPNKSTGALTPITLSSWKCVIRLQRI